LEILRRQELISIWHDSLIPTGSLLKAEIAKQLETADLIMPFVSIDYLASDFLWNEMAVALKRVETGEALVIPIIVRPSNWSNTPLAKFQALPKDARPITEWKKRDEAYANIVSGIREVLAWRSSHQEENRPAYEEFKPGVYRWPVRTATDEDVTRIQSSIVKTTIKALTDQPRPFDMPLSRTHAKLSNTPRRPSRNHSMVRRSKYHCLQTPDEWWLSDDTRGC